MNKKLITYQIFSDINLANEVAEKLRLHNIDLLIENEKPSFDPSFANNQIANDIVIKLNPQDFTLANTLLEDFYKKQLDNVDKDYYLFGFSNIELFDFVSKPDQWGKFDYQLALKILTDRDEKFTIDKIEKLKRDRIDELSKPEKASSTLLIAGYVFIFIGGIIGIIIGRHLVSSKKTLPDGQRVFIYTNNDRKHGNRIFLMSTIMVLIAIITRIIFFFIDY